MIVNAQAPFARGLYWQRVMRYGRLGTRYKAFDEDALFASYRLPPVLKKTSKEGLFGSAGSLKQSLDQTQTRALQVYRSGVKIVDWYAEGDAPGQAGRLYSVTKSILAILIGIASDQGFFPPLDSPLGDALPDLCSRSSGRITLRQLLRMDSGLAFDEGFHFWNLQVRTYLHANSRKTALGAFVRDPIGEFFHYNDFHSLLLGLVLEKGLHSWKPKYGVELQESENVVVTWLRSQLLEPLGQEHEARFVMDSVPSGFPKTESGLCLSATDLAKIGQLVLDGGQWEGTQLVSRAWLEDMTSAENSWRGTLPFSLYRETSWGPWLSSGHGYYKYHWWGIARPGRMDAFFAMGIHGQILLISPEHQAVVVRLGNRWALKAWWPEVLLNWLDEQPS